METEQDFIIKQLELIKKIDLKNVLSISDVHTIAGVDLAYWKEDEGEYADCCIVVLDFPSLKVIEEKYIIRKVEVPYIPVPTRLADLMTHRIRKEYQTARCKV